MNNNFTKFTQQANEIASIVKKNMGVISEATMKQMNFALETSTKLRGSLKQVIQTSQFLEGWENLKRGIIESEQDLKVFKYAMVELGFPPHHALSISQMRFIAQNYEDNKEEVESYIADFLNEFYNSKKLNEILIEWEDSKILEKRLPLLRNAVMAHNIGMYDLVVPAILSQLEGFLIDLFGVKGRVDGKITKIMLKHLLVEKEGHDSGFNFDDAIHKYYSEQILENFEHGKTMKYGISRHAILHGADTEFGKPSTSLKVLLLFDYLNYISDELTIESIEIANKEINQIRKTKRRTTRGKRR